MEMKILLHNEIRRMSVPVTDIDNEVRPVVKIMTEICNRKLNGRIGLALAHCQIEISKDRPLTFYVLMNGDTIINPTIISVAEKSLTTSEEGCLSFPDRPYVKIERYSRIRANYLILTAKGRLYLKDKTVSGKSAFIMQHEIGHFNLKYIYDER